MDKLFAKDKKGKGREGEERLARSEYNAIAWVNDMGRDRFGEASGRLLGEATGASDLGVKHVRVWGRSGYSIFLCLLMVALTYISWMVLVHALSWKALPACKLARGWDAG